MQGSCGRPALAGLKGCTNCSWQAGTGWYWVVSAPGSDTLLQLLERAVPPSHPKPQNQDNNGPKESQQIGAGHPEKHSATEWSACRTACLLAHFEQPLDWRLVAYTRLLLPARRRHGALPPSIHLQATAAAIN